MSIVKILPKSTDTAAALHDARQEHLSGWTRGGLDLSDRFPSEIRSVAARTEILTEGDFSDGMVIVRRGWMMQYRILEDGRRQVLQFGLPGDVIGYRADPAAPLSFSVEAVTECEFAFVPFSIARRILRQGGRDAQRLFEALSLSLDSAFDALTDAGRRNALEAVAHFIWRTSRRIESGSDEETVAEFDFPLNQEQIGDLLGLTAVHVCRTLCKLKSLGVVSLCRGKLRVEDPAALAEIAGICETHPDEWSIAG